MYGSIVSVCLLRVSVGPIVALVQVIGAFPSAYQGVLWRVAFGL